MDRAYSNNNNGDGLWSEVSSQLFTTQIQEQQNRVEPVQAERPAAVPQPEAVRLIANLNSDSWRTRESATQSLRNAGAEALPYITQALEQNPPLSLEQTRRLEQVMRYFGADGLPRMIDGMSHRDVNVRNAAIAFMSRIPTSSLLESITRFEPTQAQSTAVRNLLLGRNSEEELGRLYGSNKWKASNVDEESHRRSLGHAMLFDPSKVESLSQGLGMTLFRQGGHDAEAARLLERGAGSNEPHIQYLALRDLASIHARQGRPQEFTATMNRLLPSLRQLENTGLEGWVRDGYTDALQQIRGVLGDQRTTAMQRGQLETLQQRTQTDLTGFLKRHPDQNNPNNGKKPGRE